MEEGGSAEKVNCSVVVQLGFRALPPETQVESGTSQSKSGTSFNLSDSGFWSKFAKCSERILCRRTEGREERGHGRREVRVCSGGYAIFGMNFMPNHTVDYDPFIESELA